MKINMKILKYLVLGVFLFSLFFISESKTFGQQNVNNTVTVTVDWPILMHGASTNVRWNASFPKELKECVYTKESDGIISPGESVGPVGLIGSGFLTADTTFTVKCEYYDLSHPHTNYYISGSATTHVVPFTPPTVTISATPNNINAGGISTISWRSTGAESCTSKVLSPAISETSGSRSVSPMVTSFYAVSCKHTESGLTQYASAQTTVFVNPIPQTISEVETFDATDISATGANLWGGLNPGTDGVTGTADGYFRYSTVSPEKVTPIFCNEIYGSDMKSTNEVVPKITGTDFKNFSSTLNGLSPGTTYYYCAVGSTQAGQITYGAIKSFTTLLPPGSSPVVTTENALVAGENSAYLNGTYKTSVPVKTWFEYRKKILQDVNQIINNQQSYLATPKNFFTLIRANLSNFFYPNEAKAATATTNTVKNSWIRVGEKGHNGNTSATISYLLGGLSKGTSYEFRAGIESNTTNEIIYGETKTFATQGTTGTTPGGNGQGYVDPCSDPIDVNCNGSGGPGIIHPGNSNSLPDLTSLAISPALVLLNVSTTFSAYIKNQGGNSTSYVPPIIPANANSEAAVSFWNNLLKTNTALAAVNTATTIARPTTPPVATKGSFYNFFQVSITNPIPTVNTNTGTATNTEVSALNNFLTPHKAQAAVNTANGGGATINTNLINFAPTLMGPLAGKASSLASQNFAFSATGTFWMRVCADKKSPSDAGLIKESYENNNCGPWTTIRVINPSTTCTDKTATNYGKSLPCTYGNGGNGAGTGNGNGNGNNNGNGSNPSNLQLGDIATPPNLALVHYHEGIETVLQRQIVANTELAESYGYQPSASIETFAWDLADLLARTFGYVGTNRKEIRVITPDIAAYQLYMNNGILTIYEYYNGKIVNIQKMTDTLRNKYQYEYYFTK